MTVDQFRIRVATFLKRNKIAPSAFGRRVLNDSAWFSKLMDGCEPREKTMNAVLDAMKTYHK